MKNGFTKSKSLVIVAVAAVVIAAGVFASPYSLAEFTSSNRAKRVIAAYNDEGQQFSSNYMIPIGSSDARHYEKTIHLDSVNDDGKYINITVCNYPQSNSEHFINTDVVYSITADVVSVSGSVANTESSYASYISALDIDDVATFPQNNVTLVGAAASKDTYRIYLPKSLISDNYYVRITATADGITTIQRLLGLSYPSMETEVDWDIDCDIDDKSKSVLEYSGFNVRLFGSGAGTISLTWPASLNISDVFCDQVGASPAANSISFHVDGSVESYDLQFYPAYKGAVTSWNVISTNSIHISFTKDNQN